MILKEKIIFSSPMKKRILKEIFIPNYIKKDLGILLYTILVANLEV